LHNNFFFASGISQRYRSRVLLGLQQSTAHHPPQITLPYSPALEALDDILQAGSYI